MGQTTSIWSMSARCRCLLYRFILHYSINRAKSSKVRIGFLTWESAFLCWIRSTSRSNYIRQALVLWTKDCLYRFVLWCARTNYILFGRGEYPYTSPLVADDAETLKTIHAHIRNRSTCRPCVVPSQLLPRRHANPEIWLPHALPSSILFAAFLVSLHVQYSPLLCYTRWYIYDEEIV